MLELLPWFSVAGPLAAALGLLAALVLREPGEEDTLLGVAGLGLSLAVLSDLYLLGQALWWGPYTIWLGEWLRVGSLHVDVGLEITVAGAAYALVASALTAVAVGFSRGYMHREPGFLRLMGLLSLFAGGLSLLALASDAVLAFVGWELAGTTSALLIAYYPERRAASRAGLRAFTVNRIGDAAFLTAIATLAGEVGDTSLHSGPSAASGEAGLAIAALVALAASAKAAQLPFSPWLERAIEGPTPTSALFYGGLMVQAGVLLLARFSGALAHSPAVAAVLVGVALVSLAYAWLAALAQVDIKRSLILRTLAWASVGLTLVAIGQPTLAVLVVLAFTVFQTLRVLVSPSWVAIRRYHPTPTAPAWLQARPALQAAARERFGVEARVDRAAFAVVDTLSRAADGIEARLVEPLLGAPAPALEALAQRAESEDRIFEAQEGEGAGLHAQGLVARGMGALADGLERGESAIIAGWVGTSLPGRSPEVGKRLASFEALLQKPVVPTAIVLLSLAAVAGGLA